MSASPLPERRGDRGAALILAMVVLLALGLVLGSIATFARTSVANTINLANQRTGELNAANAVYAAIANERYTYNSSVYTSTTTDCLPSGTLLTGDPYYVYCAGTVSSKSVRTREVQFYACTSTSSCVGSSSGVALYADVFYDDIPPNATPAGYSNCGSSGTSTCGIQLNVATWDVKVADS